jgi:hypothetical protein
MRASLTLVLAAIPALLATCATPAAPRIDGAAAFHGSAKPYTRWWWFASQVDMDEVRAQLDWLEANGFGGVEIAFIYPPGRDPEAPRMEFLGPDWSQAVAETKRYADSIGLGCDFTFGTLWPFGGSWVGDADRARVFGDPDFRQEWRLSWEHGTPGNVMDHMSEGALERYAAPLAAALAPALEGSTSALFCDSWEVETRRIWTDGFGEAFQARYGYDVAPYMADLFAPASDGARYDYMKLVSEWVLERFYQPFTRLCHELGALSRVQCAGSPTDLVAAYAAVDIPESEAMLYEPGFARIPSSAAALAGRPLVSAESFTCLYGFPGVHLREELTADLKLVADALFAHGVNRIVWHGTPFNGPEGDANGFYATVHVGREGALAPDLPGFNRYLETVSEVLSRGETYTDVAVYLPLEDAWIAGEYPAELQQKWSWGAYELRYVRPPRELAGHHPLWVTQRFLRDAEWRDGRLVCGETEFTSLYVDVEYLDSEALDTILALARRGLPVTLKRDPRGPGQVRSEDYEQRLVDLRSLLNVSRQLRAGASLEPLVEVVREGASALARLPDYWCRRDGDVHYLFFAHPLAQDLTLPLERGRALEGARHSLRVRIRIPGWSGVVPLDFAPRQSLLLRVEPGRGAERIDIRYDPV